MFAILTKVQNSTFQLKIQEGNRQQHHTGITV